MFRDNLSVPCSRIKESNPKASRLLEDGVRLVVPKRRCLLVYAAQHPRRAKMTELLLLASLVQWGMLQGTRKNTIGRRSQRVRMMCLGLPALIRMSVIRLDCLCFPCALHFLSFLLGKVCS